LLDVLLTRGGDDIILVTSSGTAIRFSEQDARLMGRSAAGVKGIELAPGARIVGAISVPMTDPDENGSRLTEPEAIEHGLALLTITDQGYGKRTDVDDYRVHGQEGQRSQSRGGKGRIDIKLSSKNGTPVVAIAVDDGDDIVVVTRNGQLVRTNASSISRYGRGTQGVRVVGVNDGDAVIAAARVVEREETAEESPVES
ncbi:MAG: DNA gyrase C-terminal beta-propeller domain-containing protein, partial [Planctomycetota bacterium]